MPRTPQVLGVMCQEEGGERERERRSFGWWSGSGSVRMREGMLVVSCGRSWSSEEASHRSGRRCGMSCAKAPTTATHTTVMEHAFARSQMKNLKKEAEEVTALDGKAGVQGCPRVLASCVAAVSLTRRWPGCSCHSGGATIIQAPSPRHVLSLHHRMGSPHAPRDVKESGCVVRVGHCTHPAVNWNAVSGETVVYTCMEGSSVNFFINELCSLSVHCKWCVCQSPHCESCSV